MMLKVTLQEAPTPFSLEKAPPAFVSEKKAPPAPMS